MQRNFFNSRYFKYAINTTVIQIKKRKLRLIIVNVYDRSVILMFVEVDVVGTFHETLTTMHLRSRDNLFCVLLFFMRATCLRKYFILKIRNAYGASRDLQPVFPFMGEKFRKIRGVVGL